MKPFSEEYREWLDALRVGDTVSVVDMGRRVYTTTVKRKTPSGRLVTTSGTVFSKNGYIYGPSVSCYANRHIMPPQEPLHER